MKRRLGSLGRKGSCLRRCSSEGTRPLANSELNYLINIQENLREHLH
jgi:hypothetical protein